VDQSVCCVERVQRQEPALRVPPGGHSDQYGAASCTFLNQNANAKLNKGSKDLKIAIIYEDGPYGTGVASGNEQTCTKYGMGVLKEGYGDHPDMSVW
jgi:branched-chain amino acid transport system substrate-binding protein